MTKRSRGHGYRGHLVEIKCYLRPDQVAWLDAEATRRGDGRPQTGVGRRTRGGGGRRNQVIKDAVDQMMALAVITATASPVD